ncbi:MAG: hypothetical protein ACXWV2_10835, partial [Chitinophagaceae bacterium]
KQLVRRIQNQLIKTFDKAVNRELGNSGTYANETKGIPCMLHKPANFFSFKKIKRAAVEKLPVFFIGSGGFLY